MADILTHALTFDKQSVEDIFVTPFFEAVDVRDQITVRTDIKGTEKLNRISRPSKITKRKEVPGFTPTGTMNLTETDLTVKPVAIEFEQNGRAFLNSVFESALAQGFSEDDIENMANPDIWNQVVLPILADAGRDDLIRQMWFADETKELNVSGIIDNDADPDYQVYTGFWTRLFNDIESGALPSAQVVNIDNGAVKQEESQTLSGITGGVIDLTVNGKTYQQAFNTDSATTIANWVASHASDIGARGALTGVTVTDETGGEIKFVAENAGQAFSVVIVSPGTGGSFAQSGVVANTGHSALGVDEADQTFELMIDQTPNELLAFEQVFIATRSMVRNYIQTLKNTGTDEAHRTIINGQSLMTYEGIPIWIRPEWDINIKNDHNSVFPHRAILTTKENLLFGTDGASDDEAVETWYDRNLQQRRYRVQYKAQTLHLHQELIVVAK